MNKISIRFFLDREVRAVWDEECSKWWFSATDIVAVLRKEDDYTKAGNYWRWLKRKLSSEGDQFVSDTHKLKITAADGKKYLTDVLDSEGVVSLAKKFPSSVAGDFLDWFLYSDNTLDGRSKKKAYELIESGLLDTLEAGTLRCLQQIHSYIFGGLFPFAGQIRGKNIAKGGFAFAPCQHFATSLPAIESVPQNSLDQIIDKYVEMNIAHPFMEGNGRSTRIWLDLMLKQSLKKCIDWSKISKNDYHNAMKISRTDPNPIKSLLKNALTDKINDREMYLKGIDYSYYYEEEPL